jgi:hypothetical protein
MPHLEKSNFRPPFHETLTGAERRVIFFDIFETGFYFAFKLRGRHEKIEQRNMASAAL